MTTPYSVLYIKGWVFSLSDPRDLLALKQLGLIATSPLSYILPADSQVIDFYGVNDPPIPEHNLSDLDGRHLFVFAPIDANFHIVRKDPIVVVEGDSTEQTFTFVKAEDLEKFLNGEVLPLEEGHINFTFERVPGQKTKVQFVYRLTPTKGWRGKIFGFFINYYQDFLLPTPSVSEELIYPNQTTQFWRRSKIIPQGNNIYATFTKVAGDKYVIRNSFEAVTELEKIALFNQYSPEAVTFVTSTSYRIGNKTYEQL